MRWGFYILSALLFSLAVPAGGDPIVTLESDYFDSENFENSPNIQTLDPNFFRPRRGQLDRVQPDEYGCKAVRGANPTSEAGAVARVISDFCVGRYTVQWIPLASKSKTSEGYTRICCTRRQNEPRRRPGPR